MSVTKTDISDLVLLNYEKYVDYLRSFMTPEDRFYIPRERIRRVIVKLGYRADKPIYNEDEFWERRRLIYDFINPRIKSNITYSDALKLGDPLLQALKARELLNIQKTVSTIIFVREISKSGFERSAYIDFEHSIRGCNTGRVDATDWAAVMAGRIKLKPKETHLSYFCGKGRVVAFNSTDNYTVINDPMKGVMFMHRGDHKIIPLGPSPRRYRGNVERTVLYSPIYSYVVLYDHRVRKKN